MVVKAWTAKHTGLPCIYSDQPVRVITGDGHILADQAQGSVLVADALAAPGVASSYTVGGQQVTVTRRPSTMGVQVITGLDGRGVDGVRAQPLRDPVEWQGVVSQATTGAVRYPLNPAPRTGTIQCLVEAAGVDALWDLLRRPSPVLVGTGLPVPGVPTLFAAVVRSVQADRLACSGLTRLRIKYEEAMRPPSGAAPVVTWGEWAGLGTGWQNRTAVQVAQTVAGMPA